MPNWSYHFDVTIQRATLIDNNWSSRAVNVQRNGVGLEHAHNEREGSLYVVEQVLERARSCLFRGGIEMEKTPSTRGNAPLQHTLTLSRCKGTEKIQGNDKL